MAENPRIEELRRRVQADPASIAFAALAEEFRRLGRHDEAVQTCRTGLQRHPAYLSARVTLGRALIETGEYDAAREELETVLRSAPENLAAIRGIAQIHERLGHSAEMDPHVADMMHSHAESVRAAALAAPPAPAPTPEPPPVPELRIPVSMAPDPSFEAASPSFETPIQAFEAPTQASETPTQAFETPTQGFDAPVLAHSMAPALPEHSMAPALPEHSMAPQQEPAAAEGKADPFAAFTAPATTKPTNDFTFDLDTAFSVAPTPGLAPEPPLDLPLASFGEPVIDAPQLDVEDLPIEPMPSVDLAPEPAAPPEAAPGPDLVLIPDAVPAASDALDPAMVATLARLERFLGAIQSARAAHP